MQMFLAPEQEKTPGGKQLIHFTGSDCVAQHAAWNENRQLKQVT
jgi:hypothetical protein